MKLTDPKLTLYFLGNDLEPGHETTQILTNEDIVKSLVFKRQRFSSLKSSSDSVQVLIRRRCSSTEDIVATDGNIKAVLTDGEQTLFTGYISTNFTWTVTDHGEQALSATIEGVGTRLLSQAYIETGKHFFDGTAASVIYAVVNPLGIVLRSGDERKLLQSVSYTVEAGTTCREILDQLCYECNAVYWFNNLGELCIQQITADTSAAEEVDSDSLVFNGGKAISLSKNLRTYKGARVTYKQLGTANNYLVYRNTTNATSQRTCDLVLQGGEYFDGAEIYTEAEWSEATEDTFREPTLLGAVNAASESSIVGSGKIVNIDNLRADVEKENGLSADFENVGGGYFKLTAHNSASVARAFYRLDLYADIVYEKSDGVIRTTIDGTTEGKTLIEETLEFIHDKENAQKHANLLAQYYRYCGATYTFYTNKQLELGSVIRLHDTTFSGLDVFVLLTATEEAEGTSTVKCTGVAISTFDLEADVYHGTTEAAKQSGAQGPAGEPGASTEVQYALGDSIVDPPTAEMLWGGVEMTWNGSVMTWNEGLYSDEVPEMQRGKYIWMRSRVGNGPWNYTRLTGAVSWDAEGLGVATTACPTQSKEGLGLIPGDYFIAGATFTDSGLEYKKGYAYEYNGTGWDVLDLSQVDNADKGLQCLGDLMSSGINVTDSTASIYGWFQNLVAQQGIIKNLFSQNITILDNGCIHSNYYNSDGTRNAHVMAYGVIASASVTDSHAFLRKSGEYTGQFTWTYDAGNSIWVPGSSNPLPLQVSITTAEFASDWGISVTTSSPAYLTNSVNIIVTSISQETSGFWLGANGELKCARAKVAGDITANSFVYNGVIMKWGHFSYTAPGTYYIDLYSEYGVEYGDLVTLSLGMVDVDPVKNNTISFSLGDGVRGLQHEVTLITSGDVTVSYSRGYGGIELGLKVVLGSSHTDFPVKLAVQAYHG